jgi:hypothetical protein
MLFYGITILPDAFAEFFFIFRWSGDDNVPANHANSYRSAEANVSYGNAGGCLSAQNPYSVSGADACFLRKIRKRSNMLDTDAITG